MRSRQSSRTARTHHSAKPFAIGAWIGVRLTSIPSERNTSSVDSPVRVLAGDTDESGPLSQQISGSEVSWGANTQSERQNRSFAGDDRVLAALRVDAAAALWRRRRLRESSPDFSGNASLEAVRDHVVDDAVLLRFLCGHEVVALHVPGDLLERLPGVQGDDPPCAA
jgi:hypothetical protein